MKRKIISLILTFIMIAAALPAAAHQGFTEENLNFESYSSGMPSAANGEFASISATSDYNIVTNGAPTGNATYGNSVKMVQRYNSSSGAYSGIKYTPDSYLYNSIHLETSVYMGSASDGNKILRGIYLRDGSGSSNIDAAAITFRADAKIYAFNSSTPYTWSPDSWYDVSILYNMNTEEYKVTVFEDGDELFEKSGTHSAKNLNCITEVQIRSQHKCKDMITESTPWDDQIFYIDNFSLKTGFKFANPVANNDSVDVFDFEDYNGSNIGDLGSLGTLSKSSTKSELSIASDADGGTALALNLEYTGYIQHKMDAVETKDYICSFSFYLNEIDSQMRLRLYNKDNSSIHNPAATFTDAKSSLYITDKGTLYLAGTQIKDIVMSAGKWYKLEYMYDPDTGYAKATIYDGVNEYSNEFVDAGYVDCAASYFRIDSRAENGGTILLDDLSVGYTENNVGGFEIVDNKSTTGPDIKVDEKDSVKAVFSNKVDKDSFNSSSVTFPYNDVADYTLSFPDDYTVQINFNKELGKHYHISFTNVADTYGNTLTDFIEFDMAKAPYITGNVEFTDKDGNAVRYLTSGKVTMSVYTQAGDGVSKMANIWLALYTSTGELSDVKFESVAYEAENTKRSISITVPSDGVNYKLKGGVWKDDLTPLAFGEVRPQVVIFKLDDLRYEYTVDKKPVYDYTDFVSLANWANEEKVALAFGVICNTLEDENGIDKSGYYKAIADMDASEYIEIWCHGYTHEQTGDADTGYSAEFNAPLNDQIATLQKCANIVYEKTGVTLRSLGVPHNIKNEDTIKALESVPQFKTLIASGSVKYTGSTFIHLQNQLGFEEKTGVLYDLDTIKENFNKASSKEYVMFQGHAGRWSDEDIAKFKELVAYLKTQNVVFMTPTEYYNFIK